MLEHPFICESSPDAAGEDQLSRRFELLEAEADQLSLRPGLGAVAA